MSIGQSARQNETISATLLVPRDAIEVIGPPPDMLSQRNVEATVGIPSKAYLSLIRSDDFSVRVIKVGKLRLVNRLAFLAWLERDGVGREGIPPSRPSNDTRVVGEESAPSSNVGRLLDTVGLERVPELRRARSGKRRR